jgi:Ca2+-binding EF-hand superfamily protein
MNTLCFEFKKQEIQRFVTELDPENAGRIEFKSFSELITQKMAEKKDHIEEIQTRSNLSPKVLDQTSTLIISGLKETVIMFFRIKTIFLQKVHK